MASVTHTVNVLTAERPKGRETLTVNDSTAEKVSLTGERFDPNKPSSESRRLAGRAANSGREGRHSLCRHVPSLKDLNWLCDLTRKCSSQSFSYLEYGDEYSN